MEKKLEFWFQIIRNVIATWAQLSSSNVIVRCLLYCKWTLVKDTIHAWHRRVAAVNCCVTFVVVVQRCLSWLLTWSFNDKCNSSSSCSTSMQRKIKWNKKCYTAKNAMTTLVLYDSKSRHIFFSLRFFQSKSCDLYVLLILATESCLIRSKTRLDSYHVQFHFHFHLCDIIFVEFRFHFTLKRYSPFSYEFDCARLIQVDS